MSVVVELYVTASKLPPQQVYIRLLIREEQESYTNVASLELCCMTLDFYNIYSMYHGLKSTTLNPSKLLTPLDRNIF